MYTYILMIGLPIAFFAIGFACLWEHRARKPGTPAPPKPRQAPFLVNLLVVMILAIMALVGGSWLGKAVDREASGSTAKP